MAYNKIQKVAEKLRGDGGCPWDKEQTIKSLKKHFLSEAEEVAQAIDNDDMENLKEEIGDVFFSLALIAQIAKERGYFCLDDALEHSREKMIRRHPHVFGDKKAANTEEALKLFLEEKAKEKNR